MRRRSLVARVTLVTIGVAFLAVLVTAALSFQLLRHDELRVMVRHPFGLATGAASDTVRLLGRRLVVGLIAGSVIAAAAGYLLARRITQPLKTAAAAAQRIAAGERGVDIEGTGVAEVDDVLHALLALDEALSTSEARQREFLLSVSHEMRTPLTAIRGYSEAIRDGMIPASDMPEVGGTLVEESERLDRFVRDLLELARLEADDFRVHAEPVDLCLIVSSAAEAWAGLATRLQVRLVVDAPDEPVVVRADPMRLRQMVDGLVENALRVSPTGEPLDLVVDTTAPAGRDGHLSARLHVRDRGPGLTPQDLDVAFERGALHERYRDVRPVGTGLGLSITHRLATRMQIGLAVEAADSGGAVFTLTIPLAVPGESVVD